MEKRGIRKAGSGIFLMTVFLATAILSVNAKEALPEQMIATQEEVMPAGVYNLEAKNGTEVSCVKLTAPGLKPPVEGEAVSSCEPTEVKPVSGQENLYEITRAYWTDYNPDSDQGSRRHACRSVAGVFGPVRDADGGPVYRFFVEVRLKDAYQFPASHSALGALKFGDALVINETPVEFGQKYNLLNTWIFLGNHKGEAGLIQAFFEVRDTPLTPIDKICLTESGLTDPVPGKTAQELPKVEVMPVAGQKDVYDVTDAYWVDHEYSSTPFTGTFEDGKKYFYYIRVKLRNGYCISKTIEREYPNPWNVFINEEQVGMDGSPYYDKTASMDWLRGIYEVRVYLNHGGSSSGGGTDTGTGNWVRDARGWRHLHTDGSFTRGEWERIDGRYYHFDADGYMQTGWIKLSAWYYLGGNGAMVTGWNKISGKWYYFDRFGGMLSGWQKIGGKWYYLGGAKDGAMKTGWQKISNTWYFFNRGGDMKTGWLKSGGKWYYFESSGAMLANTSRKMGNKTYKFNASGVCTNP